MQVHSGRNNVGVELYGTDVVILSPTAGSGMETARSMEMIVDLMVTKFHTSAVTNAGFARSYSGLVGLSYDSPAANTAVTAPFRYRSTRVGAGTVTKNSGDGTLTIGQRTVLRGLDDGTNVYAWQDGEALGSATAQADWTAANAAIITSPAPIGIGGDSGNAFTLLVLYEYWVKVNGTLVLHWRPKWSDRGEAAIEDRSPFNNDASFGAGVEDTQYRFVKAWGKVTP